ncbi:SanA/YdcF family protein [Salegentibacter chungangensis]|uniref:Vancomycin high temperature exclusion protein n=1 Tax=Salegentibacter chungangensis TaxID=1335724 RepID=A0ABW3NU90_9FLAO
MKQIKKAILALSLSLIVAILIALGLEAYIEQDTAALVYEEIENVPETNTAIILGASVHSDGKLSPILKDRVDAAISLYENNKIDRFLVSGDHRRDDYNEVSAMSNYLTEKGIPKDRIILDHAGIDTYDSMYRSGEVFGIEDGIIVTQRFHLPRAVFIAKNLGLNYSGYAAPAGGYQPDNRIKRREKLANFKAVWEILLKKKPGSLEKRISSN